MKLSRIVLSIALLSSLSLQAGVVNVGSGSYTTDHPGYDQAGRNKVPAGTPQLSGDAVGHPVPTNDWWSNVLYKDQSENIFAYPMGMRTRADGLTLAYIPKGAMVDFSPVHISVGNITSAKTTVSDYSDWTFTMRWGSGSEYFDATAGLAMPFVYFTKHSSQSVTVTFREGMGTVSVDGSTLVLSKGFNGASFAIYAPEGSTWTGSGYSYTSTLGGKNYWSAAILPLSTTDAIATARSLRQYAFVFPADTRVDYSYDEATAQVRTDYVVTPDVKEGSTSTVLLGLLPHHWAHLASGSAVPTGLTYTTLRGDVRTLAGNRFSTVNTFGGILPTLPYVEEGASAGFSKAELDRLEAEVVADHGLTGWTDSYNDGQLLNRLIQTAHVAKASGNNAVFNQAFNLVKQRLENWLTYTSGEKAFLFYYNKDWTTMFGYPAGHGQDEYINDHHFHWGYFIHAAAFIEQYSPGWATQWGDMVNLLVRDAATSDRNDPMFPYLRNFSPYAGHCWANGVASLPQGNDQESTSESMQFHSSLIHWGSVTGNRAVRDLGIYMYATEQSAVEEYWFDQHERIFPSDWKYSLVSRVFGNDFDNGTFWTADIAASYGIELYPIHGGSFYLGRNLDYVRKLWSEIAANTGILSNEVNPNLWHDTMWEYLSFIDPQKAIELYNSNPKRNLKFGISQAQTYHWLHAMNVLGQYDSSVTADYPVAMVFRKGDKVTHVAYNYDSAPRTVTFSDGATLVVEARSMGIDGGIVVPPTPEEPTTPVVTVTSPAVGSTITVGEAATLQASATVEGSTITGVDFLVDGTLVGTATAAPYAVQWTPTEEGVRVITARATAANGKQSVSASIEVNVRAASAGGDSGDGGGCSVTSDELTEGSGMTYSLKFETAANGDVTVTAEGLTDVIGLVAFVRDLTNGFTEMQMQEAGGQKFTYTLTGHSVDETITVACKFAWAGGGIGVTAPFTYVVGDNCNSSMVEREFADSDVRVYPVPASDCLHIDIAGTDHNHIYIWSADGSLMLDSQVGASTTVNVLHWHPGVYFLRVESGNAMRVERFVKR